MRLISGGRVPYWYGHWESTPKMQFNLTFESSLPLKDFVLKKGATLKQGSGVEDTVFAPHLYVSLYEVLVAVSATYRPSCESGSHIVRMHI